MINLLRLKMRKYRHVHMLVNQSILNVLLDFDWLLKDGFGYYPHGNQGRLSFGRYHLTIRVIAMDLLLS